MSAQFRHSLQVAPAVWPPNGPAACFALPEHLVVVKLVGSQARAVLPLSDDPRPRRMKGFEFVQSVTASGVPGLGDVLWGSHFCHFHESRDVFVQGERATDRSEGGIGIGLTIVTSHVELHGGSVAARNVDGGGAEFVVTHPKPQETDDTVQGPRGRAARQPKATRVLVVDDNCDAAELLAEALELFDFDVRVAPDGPSALAAAVEFQPHAAVVDIGLPLMDGYELGERLRALLGDGVTLIAVTGYGRDTDRERSRSAGFTEHLVKPVSIERVTACLKRACS